MNKKILLSITAIIFVLLIGFVIGDDIINSLSPASNSVINSTHNFIASITIDPLKNEIKNVTFYYNITETAYYLCNDTNETAGETSFSCKAISTIPEGTYTFYGIGYTNDSEGKPIQINAFKSEGVTVDNTPPLITTNYLDNWTNKTDLAYEFRCSATDNFNLSKIGLIIWNNNTGVQYKSNYSNVFGSSNSSISAYALTSNTIYLWSCNATDNVSFSTVYPINYTIYVDNTIPTMTITAIDIDVGDPKPCSCTATDIIDSNPIITEGSCPRSEAGEYNYTCKVCDHAINCISGSKNYTVSASSGGSSGGEEGAGGGGDEGTGSKVDTGARSEEHCWDTIELTGINYSVETKEIGISKITLVPKTVLTNACLNIKQVINIEAANVAAYSDSTKVYKYFKIEPSGFYDKDLSKVIIEFSVPKTWTYNHKKDTVALNRYTYQGWGNLPTEHVSEDTDFVYLSAESPGFSNFVITGDVIAAGGNVSESCGNGACEVNENATTCCKDCGCPKGQTCSNNKCGGGILGGSLGNFFLFKWFSNLKLDFLSNKFWFGWPIWLWIVIGVVVIALAILIIFFRKKIHFPFKINFSIQKKDNYGFKD